MKLPIQRTDDGTITIASGFTPPALAFRDQAGDKLEAARRAELLSRARAGDVEPIAFDARVYRQRRGEPLTPGVQTMQNYVQIRPGAMAAHARSYRGLPFLAAHDVGDPRARAGTIADSWLDRGAVADGEDPDGAELVIRHSIDVVAPWAVAGVLDGTIDRFSIHFAVTGEIWCSVHNARIWSKCYCLPGQLVGDKADPNRPRAYWIVQNATGREVSAVNVPAVGNGATGIEAVRFAVGGETLTGARAADLVGVELLAGAAGVAGADFREALAAAADPVYHERNPRNPAPEDQIMSFARLATVLGVALAAGANPNAEQVDALALKAEQLTAERDAYKGRAEAAERDLKAAADGKRKAEIDNLISTAYGAGKLVRGKAADGADADDPQEATLRRLGDKLGAAELKAHVDAMPARAPSSRLQSDTTTAPKRGALPPELDDAMKLAAEQCGITPEEMATARRDLGIEV